MKTYDVHSEIKQPQPTAVSTTTIQVSEIGPWLATTFLALASAISARGVGPAGPPFARYHQAGDDLFAIEAGFPVIATVEIGDGVLASELPGGTVAILTHTGPYEEMAPAYQALTSWISDHGGEPIGDPWEVYLSDPATQPDPATWRTDIVQPYRPAA